MNCFNCEKIMPEDWISVLCPECQVIYIKELNSGNPTDRFFEIQNKLPSSQKSIRPRWDQTNPAFARIGQICRDYPKMVSVLYECSCKNDKKINHHFDYSRPFEVIRLCSSCHRNEHSRLSQLKDNK